jgi:hypothetical protein
MTTFVRELHFAAAARQSESAADASECWNIVTRLAHSSEVDSYERVRQTAIRGQRELYLSLKWTQCPVARRVRALTKAVCLNRSKKLRKRIVEGLGGLR